MSYATQLPASAKRLYKETRVGMGGGKLTARAAWSCDFADLWDFLTIVNGTTETVNGTTQRIVPLRFPDKPQYLIASKVDGKETGYDHNANTYSKCRIDIDFETPQFALSGSSAFAILRRNFAGNMITMPGNAFHFGDGTKVMQDAGRLVPEIEYQLTLYQVPTFTDDAVASLEGCVNTATFMGRDPGTVLFVGAESDVQTTALFVQSYEVTLGFKWRPVPWNYLMKPDGTGFAAVTDGSGAGIYPTADLSPLLSI